MNPDQDREEAVRQLNRVGFDDLRGVITDLPRWETALNSYRTATVKEFVTAVAAGEQILDARAPNEWEDGSIAASHLRYAPDMSEGAPNNVTKDRPVWVACETGYRASIAASFLRRDGYEPVVLMDAGVTDFLSELSNSD